MDNCSLGPDGLAKSESRCKRKIALGLLFAILLGAGGYQHEKHAKHEAVCSFISQEWAKSKKSTYDQQMEMCTAQISVLLGDPDKAAVQCKTILDTQLVPALDQAEQNQLQENDCK